MTSGTQSVLFNAVPLLVLAAVYLAVTAALAPVFWRERGRLGIADLALALVFPCIGIATAVFGAVIVDDRKPIGGQVWPSFAACLLALVPPLLLVARRGDWRFLAARSAQVRRAEQRTETLGRELESVAQVITALARTRDRGEAARILLDEVHGLLGVDFAALALVDDDERTARGFLARGAGDVSWWRDVRIDLEAQPSGIASAYHDAAPVVVYDCTNSPIINKELARRVGSKSAAFVPLVVDERVTGVLVVATTAARRAFRTEDTRVLEAIASDAALALDRARSADALRQALRENERRLDRQAALLDAAQVLSSELRLEAVLERLVEQVARLLGADAADCYLYDPKRRTLRCAAVYGLSSDLLGFEFSAEKGVAGIAIREAGPAIASDYGEFTDPVPHAAYSGFGGALVTPMRWSGETYGVLGVGARGERTFTPEDGEVLDAFAGLASLALRNAEAFEERTQQARVQRGFFRISDALGQSLSLTETLDAAAQAAAEALGASFAAVLMPGGEGLELSGSHALPEALARELEHGLPASASCLAVVASEGRLLAAASVTDDDRFDADWRDLAARSGYSSLLAVPVTAPRRESGGVVLVFFSETRVFTDDVLELARHLADAARGALERADLYESERTARALAQQLARTGSLLAAELDPAAVLDEVVQQAPKLVGADACAIRVLEGDELAVSAVEGEGTAPTLGAHSPSTSWLSGDVVQSRTPVAVDDAAADRRYVEADPVLAAGYRGYLGVPLVGPEGTLHGALSVYTRRPRSWRDEEVEALRALAGNTAAALSNAELYQRVALDKERSFAILGNVADGIVAVDRDGKVVLWNAAAERITGVPTDEAVGRTPFEVLRRDLESGGELPAGERLVSIPRADDEVWLSVSEAVMRDPAGAVAGRIFAFRDISADRLVEQMKSRFVSTVSHELRTPLTSIYGFAATLLRDDVEFSEEERLTFLRYIARESDRLTTIVDELLNVARLDAGDLQVTIAPTDVRTVAAEVIEGAEDAGDGSGRSFVLDLPQEPLAAAADPDKLRQVLAILVENAVKYSPEHGRVTVEARRRSDKVEVRVVDEGIGIPESEYDRIFRKFYRGEDVGNGTTSGTGLGLFIARELVSAMGGRIWVSSAEGGGSSFAFELPLAQA